MPQYRKYLLVGSGDELKCGSVGRSICSPVCSPEKSLTNCQPDCHDIYCSFPWSPEDDPTVAMALMFLPRFHFYKKNSKSKGHTLQSISFASLSLDLSSCAALRLKSAHKLSHDLPGTWKISEHIHVIKEINQFLANQAITFYWGIHSLRAMNSPDFGDSLTSPLATSWRENISLCPRLWFMTKFLQKFCHVLYFGV